MRKIPFIAWPLIDRSGQTNLLSVAMSELAHLEEDSGDSQCAAASLFLFSPPYIPPR